jgi:hypothetical protein
VGCDLSIVVAWDDQNDQLQVVGFIMF